jgi:hypothetical protein
MPVEDFRQVALTGSYVHHHDHRGAAIAGEGFGYKPHRIKSAGRRADGNNAKFAHALAHAHMAAPVLQDNV